MLFTLDLGWLAVAASLSRCRVSHVNGRVETRHDCAEKTTVESYSSQAFPTDLYFHAVLRHPKLLRQCIRGILAGFASSSRKMGVVIVWITYRSHCAFRASAHPYRAVLNVFDYLLFLLFAAVLSS